MRRVLPSVTTRRVQHGKTFFRQLGNIFSLHRTSLAYLLFCFLLYVYFRCYLGVNFGGYTSLQLQLKQESNYSQLQNNINQKGENGALQIFWKKMLSSKLRYQSTNRVIKNKEFSLPITARDLSNVTSSMVVDNFKVQWRRFVYTGTDWKGILRPCKSQMKWESRMRDSEERTSAFTSRIQSQIIRPAGEFSHLFIESRTADDKTKTVGGDAWRVYVQGPASLVARVIDHANGTYEAMFLVLEPGIYTVAVLLDFSLCDGLRDPPTDWFVRGNAQGKYQPENLLGPLNNFLPQRLGNQSLTIRVPESRVRLYNMDVLFQTPSTCQQSCRSLWNGYGRWANNTWRPYFQDPLDWHEVLRDYPPSGTLLVYGDSVAKRLVLSARKRALCGELYRECLFSYNWIYPVVSSEQREIVEQDDLDFDEQRVLNQIRKALSLPEMKNNLNSTLLLNLGIHFIMTLNFSAYQRLINATINLLKETERSRELRYKANVIWKSSTAIYNENNKHLNSTHFRFLTSQRILLFNAYSTWAMCQAGYDVVDVHPITDSYPYGPIDVVHYHGFVTHALEQVLEENKMNEYHSKRHPGNHFIHMCAT